MKRTQWKSILFVSLMLFTGACATSQHTEDGGGADAIPTADAGTDVVPQATVDAPFETPPAEPLNAAPQAPVEPTPEAPAASAIPAGDGGTENYTVQDGDTLMKIAFEMLGDLYKWKEIYEQNKDKISDPNRIPKGIVLTFNKTGASSVEKNGEKYLIKQGDTLGTISNAVYGTKSRWKEIWENNKQLIHDPNKIFAGFYLYYMNGSTNRVMGSTDLQPSSDAKTVEAGTASSIEPNPAPAAVPAFPPAAPADATAEKPADAPPVPVDPNAPPTL